MVALLLSVLGCTEPPPGAADPDPTPATNPAEKPVPDAPSSSTRSPKVPKVPFEVDLPGTQPRWDPRKVDELPIARAGTVPGLPSLIDPPNRSVSLREAPIDAAVVVVEQNSTAQLLTLAGEWRSVPLTGRHPTVALSPGGTRLLVTHLADEPAAPVLVHDLSTGESREVPAPDAFREWDYAFWTWVDEDTLLLDDLKGGWLVNSESGRATRVPYPSAISAYWTIDPDGALVTSAEWGTPRVFEDWSGSGVRKVSMRATGRLGSLVADRHTVVGSSYDGHPFSVIVADRMTLAPQWVLPVLDVQGNYSPGALRPLALRDDGTVLLRVSVLRRGRSGFRVVAWDPRSGDLSLAASADVPMGQQAEFAEGLLRRTGP